MGFGFDQITHFVTMNKPDVIIIYNDMVVVSNILEKLKSVPNRSFKVIVYMDQVYLYQKKGSTIECRGRFCPLFHAILGKHRQEPWNCKTYSILATWF